MSETKKLVEALTDEILRVNEIMGEYLSFPNRAGNLAASRMEQAINAARKAQASGDILQMIPALETLRGFEL